jgi:hypothetical protein
VQGKPIDAPPAPGVPTYREGHSEQVTTKSVVSSDFGTASHILVPPKAAIGGNGATW